MVVQFCFLLEHIFVNQLQIDLNLYGCRNRNCHIFVFVIFQKRQESKTYGVSKYLNVNYESHEV